MPSTQKQTEVAQQIVGLIIISNVIQNTYIVKRDVSMPYVMNIDIQSKFFESILSR